ncbi:MAG: hypothetical protein MUF15_06610 [Acidobacteria bacterium]|jgi:hypothetical protein|nr:hypothetical protein [Acidobacteriota bacterium]
MISKILRWFAIGLIAALIFVFVIYRWDMKRAYKRVQGKSTIIPSVHGDIEYTESGSGHAVLLQILGNFLISRVQNHINNQKPPYSVKL